MRADLTDPRYVVEENANPIFRVDFCEREYGATEEYRLFEAANVSEVQRWVAARIGNRDATIWVEYEGPHGTGMAKLETISGS